MLRKVTPLHPVVILNLFSLVKYTVCFRSCFSSCSDIFVEELVVILYSNCAC